MATFTKVGNISRSKKDPNKFNLCMESNGVKNYFILKGKPTEEDVANNPKLAKIAEKWPDWVKFEVIKIED